MTGWEGQACRVYPPIRAIREVREIGLIRHIRMAYVSPPSVSATAFEPGSCRGG